LWWDLALSHGFLIFCDEDQNLRVWRADTYDLLHIITCGLKDGFISCFQHDESRLVTGSSARTGSSGRLDLWDIRNGQHIAELAEGLGSVRKIALQGDSLVAMSSRDGATIFHCFDLGSVPRSLDPHHVSMDID
jgi:WD40 repeat protein